MLAKPKKTDDMTAATFTDAQIHYFLHDVSAGLMYGTLFTRQSHKPETDLQDYIPFVQTLEMSLRC